MNASRRSSVNPDSGRPLVARGLLAVLLVTSAAHAAFLDTVRISTGAITGAVKDGVHSYLGIPYAAPPVGNLRWAPPVEPIPWLGLKQMTKFGPACPQERMVLIGDIGRESEDCLYLNVWSPGPNVGTSPRQLGTRVHAEAPGSRRAIPLLPVMVWIHGGAFEFGAASQPLYNGDLLARKGVVVVTINYRLGPFGFLAHPALSAEVSSHCSGNYGIMDQIMALKWVRDNIRQFRGDPYKVTIFGESAGGVSVAALMTSPLAVGLFSRAIIESGMAPGKMKNLAAAESLGALFARKLGARDLTAMRRKSSGQVQAAWKSALDGVAGRYALVTDVALSLLIQDGYVLPEAPGRVFAAHRQANVPLIVGSNRDEGTIFVPRGQIKSAADYGSFIRRRYGTKGEEVLKRYTAGSRDSAYDAMGRLIGDYFTAGSRRMARGQSAIQPNTYRYQFTRETQIGKQFGIGVFHGSELLYLFGDVKQNTDDWRLHEEMADFWTNFAQTGEPSRNPGFDEITHSIDKPPLQIRSSRQPAPQEAPAPVWPQYDSAERCMILDVPPRVEEHLRQDPSDFIDSLGDW